MFFIGVLLGVFYGLSADIAFPFHLSIERSHRESNFPELVHRQFHDVGALHGTGIRTAAGDMAAFPAGTGAQDRFCGNTAVMLLSSLLLPRPSLLRPVTRLP